MRGRWHIRWFFCHHAIAIQLPIIKGDEYG